MKQIFTQENIFKSLFFLCAIISIVAVLTICLFLFSNAIPTLYKIGLKEFLFGEEWLPIDLELFGIFPMILGTFYVSAFALIISVPVGLLSAIFLSAFCPNYFKKILTFTVELLSAIPSVVYGFFGLVILVPFINNTFNGGGKSLLSAAIILSIMILPTIILVSKSALDAVPKSYTEAALALGISPERSVFFIQLKAAKSGILASVILGLGRAIGEAMAVIMVAGNQVQIPHSLLDGVRTLSTNIVLEMGYAQDLHREALIANAAVLFVFILLINFSFKWITIKK